MNVRNDSFHWLQIPPLLLNHGLTVECPHKKPPIFQLYFIYLFIYLFIFNHKASKRERKVRESNANTLPPISLPISFIQISFGFQAFEVAWCKRVFSPIRLSSLCLLPNSFILFIFCFCSYFHVHFALILGLLLSHWVTVPNFSHLPFLSVKLAFLFPQFWAKTIYFKENIHKIYSLLKLFFSLKIIFKNNFKKT